MSRFAAQQLRRAHRAYAALVNKLYRASLGLNDDPALRLVVDQLRATIRPMREPLLEAIKRAEDEPAAAGAPDLPGSSGAAQ
jgi:hypothetical protein